MTTNKEVAYLIEQVKSFSEKMGQAEREILRDELLAYLLFGNYHDVKSPVGAPHDSFRELTRKERELIRKLANQTEALYRAHKPEEEDCD
ncbi:MAG TPA: hypothetical protein PKD91_11910 [Bacteroidia bacterium]|nr:hypothetical protein [Bacteroidia bacterium]